MGRVEGQDSTGKYGRTNGNIGVENRRKRWVGLQCSLPGVRAAIKGI